MSRPESARRQAPARTLARSRTARTVGVTALIAMVLVSGGVAGAAGAADRSEPPERTGAVAASAPDTREAAALTGTAKLDRPGTEDITFRFDAHLAEEHRMDPNRASGTFRFEHLDEPGGKGAWAEGRIDCLLTGGKVATATGIVTQSNLPDLKDVRVGFSVHDIRGQDRLGYSWAAHGTAVDQPGELAKCASAAPIEKVRKGTGNFEVVPWEPDWTAGRDDAS